MHKNGILARELVRQAMLIAARDELGLATRDAVLGEPLPGSSGELSLRLGSFVSSGNGTMQTNHAFVTRGVGTRAERLLVVDLPCPYSPIGTPAKLVERAEALSRAEFPGLLRKLGAAGEPNAARADAKVPAGVEDRLAQLGLTGPFAAVRALHEAIRTDGESPERLGALARGYALLGVLSEFQWHPAHKAYKAPRPALRPAAGRPRSRRTPGPSGTARSSSRSSACIARRSPTWPRRDRPAPARQARPDWVGVIEALAHQDTRKLEAVRGSQAKLAALSSLLVVKYPLGTRQTLAAARRVVELEPECFGAHDIICRIGGVANGHTATTIGPEVFAKMLPGSLKAMPGLPAPVRAFLDHPVGGDPAVFDRFEKAGAPGDDRGEPSWAAMGHFFRETRFLQVYRRLHFMRFQWAVPVNEYWNEVRLSAAGHRFYPLLEIIALRPPDPVREYADFFARLNRLDLELTEIGMFRMLQQTKDQRAMRAHHTAELMIDEVAPDLSADIQDRDPRERVPLARILLEVSPESPYALATLIEHDQAATAAQVADWSKRAPDSPLVLAALARLHTEQKKPREAERDLIRFLSLYPERWAYQMLAENAKARGDLARWQENLERALDTEETGLEHTRILVELADHFMDQGQWTRAKDYAEAAGESWAAWAMSCAQRCAEGMKDWPRAELWAQRQSERYAANPASLFQWYMFCVKTGRGDLPAARQFTEEAIRDLGGLENIHPDFRGYYQWIKGDVKAALGSFQELYARDPSFSTCLPVIAVAERLGDRATAEKYRKLLLDKHRHGATYLTGVVELVFKALDAGKSRPPDLKAVNQALEKTPAQVRPHAEVWTGIVLDARGQAAAARPFFERSLSSGAVTEWRRTIAGQALRRGRR